jgi:Zn-dependent protease with chaperone function
VGQKRSEIERLDAKMRPTLRPSLAERPGAALHARRAAASAAAAPPSAPPPPTAGAATAAARRLRGLRAADFRHSLDAQNTRLLAALPGLEPLVRAAVGGTAERVLLLENTSASVRVGPDQLPSLHARLRAAAAALDMPPAAVPELYVKQHPVPNAYTLAIQGRTPFIVVHTALLELLAPEEVGAVLAHELGHLLCDHGVWLTAASALASGAAAVLPGVGGAVEAALLRWARAAELSCDRAAVLATGDARVVISALMKLAGGSPSLAAELSVDAFLAQARSYDELTLNGGPIGWFLRNAQSSALSHPLPVLRAREVDRWAASGEYRALVERRGGGGGG